MGLELLFLLLPVATLSGWLIGRRSLRRHTRQECNDLSADYFKGLNHLLNEQPDKAIEVFVHMMQVDSDTVEVHFALARLFRRRGEVDRAIRIHQNLIARPTLEPRERNQALLELGRDYMRAGLLDRAESLFQELTEDPVHGAQALNQLLDIYQQEKEWERAIRTARRLENQSNARRGDVIAHFYCELGEQAKARGDTDEALKQVRAALAEDPASARAGLLEGALELQRGNHRNALKALARVAEEAPEFAGEAVAPLRRCYAALGRSDELVDYLRGLLEHNHEFALVAGLAELIGEQQGAEAASRFLAEHLERHPSVAGMVKLMELDGGRNGTGLHTLGMLRQLGERMLRERPAYKCRQCGFGGKKLYWQCPGCRSWNTMRAAE